MMNWWSLPGPRAFVEQVLMEIRQGKSVFLYLPKHYPKRLPSVVKEALQDDYRWLSLSSYDGSDPVEYLFETCVPDADRESLRTVQGLLGQESFQGQVIWLDGIGRAHAELWTPFFLEYERLSRAVSLARQTLFIIPLEGPDCSSTLPIAVGLGHCRWDDCLRRADMPLYGAFLVETRGSSLETDLVIALVATLSGWDPDLCEFLAPLDLTELIAPQEKLLAFADQRGWNGRDRVQIDASSWELGLWQTVGGNPTVHTSLSTTADDVDRLIWKAEVGILLPHIEEQRQVLLDQYGTQLTVPFYTNQGDLVDDIRDLEIGLIHYQLRECTGVPAETKAVILNLKRARNSLSHLEAVDTRVLMSICGRASTR